MGIFDCISGCCSCDTVVRDEPIHERVIRPKPLKTELVEKPKVEKIDISSEEQAIEVVEEEVIPEPTDDAETKSKASPISKKPLKDGKARPGRRKIALKGAAAAVPPCSTEECVGSVPKVTSSKVTLSGGAHLVYSLENNGSLNMVFTKTKISSLDGVLAYIKPSTEFSPYHYTENEGCQSVATNIQRTMQSEYTSDRKAFYDAWRKFLKLIASVNGVLYLMEASTLSPPPKVQILLYKDGSIQIAKALTPITLKDYNMVGILPHSVDHTKLEQDITDRVTFPEICEEYGSVLII